MKRELFLETMSAIEQQYRHDEKCREAFKAILINDHVSGYDNHWLQDSLIKLLKLTFSDNHRDSWIEYFIWELDFGKNYNIGSATRKDGTPINLSDASKLYDFLLELNSEPNPERSVARGAQSGNQKPEIKK
jgi:hypothetical protein